MPLPYPERLYRVSLRGDAPAWRRMKELVVNW